MSNRLYFAVLPVIHMGETNFGSTEQILTLLADQNLATEFFPDEVDSYIATFMNRTKYLTGGYVKGYDVSKKETDGGRVIVTVKQNVG